MTTDHPLLYALLVGINTYRSPNLPQLKGSINDVMAMAQLLQDRFNVPANQIKLLTDEQATRQAIKTVFHEHLLEPARSWAEGDTSQPPPAFLFHYSGHGSQVPDERGQEADGLTETIVPYDSRVGEVYDIQSWELGQMIGELTAYFTDQAQRIYRGNVTVILDCCHSGTGLRAVGDDILPSRHCQPDTRPQPRQRPSVAGGLRDVTPASGWMEQHSRYTLLAACRAQEEAYEHIIHDGEVSTPHGVLSYFLTRELARMKPDLPLTYRELHERVRHQVNSAYQRQTPQCEGDRDRQIFGGLHPARDTFLTVLEQSKGFVWVEGGLAHGLTAGSELVVYPAEMRRLEEAVSPLAILAVRTVGAVRSGCQIIDGGRRLPLPAKAVIQSVNSDTLQKRVRLALTDLDRLAAVESRLAEADIKNYVTIVGADGTADFRVAWRQDAFEIQDGAGVLLVAPFATDDLTGLGRDLAHLIRYRNARELHNQALDASLNGLVTIEIKKLGVEPDTQRPVAEDFPRTVGGELIIETEVPFIITVTNRASIPLYFAVLEFGYTWDINLLYPEAAGVHEQLAPGHTHRIGLSPDPEGQLEFWLPTGVSEVRQSYKVIATKDETEFEILTQGELKTPFSPDTRSVARSAIDDLLSLAMLMDVDTRRVRRKRRAVAKDEWTTAQIDYQVVRAKHK